MKDDSKLKSVVLASWFNGCDGTSQNPHRSDADFICKNPLDVDADLSHDQNYQPL